VVGGGSISLDKSISARRKAQQLARNGDLAGAVEELDRVVQAGEGDPYDFVFRGDLLARLLRFDEAVFAYEEAISAYERVGLYRNAIAICKKVLRTDPARKRTHGRLGDLYSKEGLASDAVNHFLAFLDGAGMRRPERSSSRRSSGSRTWRGRSPR